jgi:twitching motility protein PilJ
MGFSLGFLSRGRAAPEDEAPTNSEFAYIGEPEEPAAPEAPLRLRDALGKLARRQPAAAPSEQGAESEFKLPLIGHLRLQKQLSILSTVLAVSLACAVLFVGLNTRNSARLSAQSQVASDALMLAQRIAKSALGALQGKPEAFRQLDQSRTELNRDLNLMAASGNATLAQAARKQWQASDRAAAVILGMKGELAEFDQAQLKLNARTPALLAQTEELAALKVQRGAGAREVALLGRLMMLTQRLSRSAVDLPAAGGVTSDTAALLARDAAYFGAALDGFLNGSDSLGLAATREPELRAKFEALQKRFDEYQFLLGAVLGKLDRIVAAKRAERQIFGDNEALLERLSQLQQSFRDEQTGISVEIWIMLGAALLTLIAAAAIGRVLLQDSRNRTRGADRRRQQAEEQRLQSQRQEEQAKATNDQNQAAILRLMNELQEVADGDLTVQATVSEDITGAIADSVNYTVEELRGLVGRVTTTAEQVTKASSRANAISADLLKASQLQSREIADASATVIKMAGEITDVSKSAAESADVARQSVAAARQGSTAVENAIKGMHEIREQIQETSKRIKRLGESSQEIGEITELISDITEQTNVLALNAAIQAASAGEAGRGFSVVAEEVQRLAERSAAAAKQIGALVRTIQTDTHDAVAAMEKSTRGVVEGARLSDAAGAALNDISQVSNRLAELISGISFATGLQATSANGVANSIEHILSVTEQTQGGTQQTAQSIRTLSLLAQELKNSVSRFRIGARA